MIDLLKSDSINHTSGGGDLWEKKFRSRLRKEMWDFDSFKKILIECSRMDAYPFFTADRIDIGLLEKGISKIQRLTDKNDREYGRVCFAELLKGKLIWGKIDKNGSKKETQLDIEKPPEAGMYKKVIMAHTHPNVVSAFRFSNVDFETFLYHNDMFVSILSLGNIQLMLVKTDSTKEKINVYSSLMDIKKEITTIFFDDYQVNQGRNGFLQYKLANQLACVQFGMSMYISRSDDAPGIFNKVDIFNGLDDFIID